METFESWLGTIDGIVWGPFLLIPLLLLTGLWLTIKLRGVQFRELGSALRLALLERKDADAEGGDISQFQALTTALAATVGTGNIVGVATAISIGGPGALFWMWVTGLVGMASKYSEAFLAVRFRTKDAKGDASGGPQYYLKKALPGNWGVALSIIFAIFAVLASFGIGNMTQGNSVAANAESAFGIDPQISGIVMALLVGLVILGGIRAIGTVTAALVPIMIVFYVLGALYILIVNIADVPAALGLIFTQAFTGPGMVGGAAGGIMIAIQMGVARGIFSNESGMGSAAIAAAAAKTTHPVRQGLVSMTQTFIDTIIVVSFTGLVLVTTGVWNSGESPALLTSMAFSHGLPGNWGGYIVAIGVIFFAFSTIIGWSYYGDRCTERLFGARGYTLAYRIVFTVVVYIGATVPLTLVWTFADIMNGLMALPNLIGLLALSGLIARETAHYLKNDPKLRANKAEVDAFMAGQPRMEDPEPEPDRV